MCQSETRVIAETQSLSEAGGHIDAGLGKAERCMGGNEKILLLAVLFASSGLNPRFSSQFAAERCIFP